MGSELAHPRICRPQLSLCQQHPPANEISQGRHPRDGTEAHGERGTRHRCRTEGTFKTPAVSGRWRMRSSAGRSRDHRVSDDSACQGGPRVRQCSATRPLVRSAASCRAGRCDEAHVQAEGEGDGSADDRLARESHRERQPRWSARPSGTRPAHSLAGEGCPQSSRPPIPSCRGRFSTMVHIIPAFGRRRARCASAPRT